MATPKEKAMPRGSRIAPAQRRSWLEAYEWGDRIDKIAREAAWRRLWDWLLSPPDVGGTDEDEAPTRQARSAEPARCGD